MFETLMTTVTRFFGQKNANGYLPGLVLKTLVALPLVGMVTTFGFAGLAIAGFIFVEQQDAGDTYETATSLGEGYDCLGGQLNNTDDVDMFEFVWPGGPIKIENTSDTTVDFDLWIFQNSDPGNPTPPSSCKLKLSPSGFWTCTGTGPGPSEMERGIYFLAIAGSGSYPVDTNGQPIRSGSTQTLGGWKTDQNRESGNYRILLNQPTGSQAPNNTVN